MTDQSSTAGTVGAYGRDSWPAGWKPEAGDWVVAAGPHQVAVFRLVRRDPHTGAWVTDGVWPISRYNRCADRVIVRPATPDEIAKACLSASGEEGTP